RARGPLWCGHRDPAAPTRPRRLGRADLARCPGLIELEFSHGSHGWEWPSTLAAGLRTAWVARTQDASGSRQRQEDEIIHRAGGVLGRMAPACACGTRTRPASAPPAETQLGKKSFCVSRTPSSTPVPGRMSSIFVRSMGSAYTISL